MVFAKPGKENTEAAVKIALEQARARGIKHIMVASSTGYTASFLKGNSDIKVVAVTLAYGYKEPNQCSMSDQTRAELIADGIYVVTAAHALSGVERSMSTKFQGIYPTEIIAHSLRMLGQGVKVCVECSTMAADCGAVPMGEDIIAIAGTGNGADTVVVLKPSTSQHIFNTKICEILCKPTF